MAYELRPYQKDAIHRIRDAFSRVPRVLFQAPTGAGKTVIFSTIARGVEARGNSLVILVHRQELVEQCSMSLAENTLNHRIIAPATVQKEIMREQMRQHSKTYIHPASDVVVASVQTLIRNFRKLPPPTMIITDEAHHLAKGNTWDKVAQQYPNARSLGVTATPVRLDGKGLKNCFDELVIGPSVQSLIDENYLCRPRVFQASVTADLGGVHTKFGDYQKNELEEAMSQRALIGDAVQHYRDICPGVPAIAFCVSVKHAKMVAQQFCDSGFRAVALDGNTDKGIRRKALKALGDGQLDIVTSCDLISEGVDVPLVGAAILLRPTQSVAIALQQMGRVLRLYPMQKPIMQEERMQCLIGENGEHQAFILDHAGNTLRHGLPQMERGWTLTDDRQRRKRKSLEPPVVVCPTCQYTNEVGATQCERCKCLLPDTQNGNGGDGSGVRLTPEVINGKLVEANMKPHWAGGLSLKASPLRDLVPLAKTREQLQEIQHARGYKDGWPYWVLSERRQGREPVFKWQGGRGK